MLDELIEQAPALRLPENRLWVAAFAADLLWTRDEKRARALFNEATNTFISITNQADDSSDSLQAGLSGLRSNVMVLRGQTYNCLEITTWSLLTLFWQRRDRLPEETARSTSGIRNGTSK